MTDKTRIQLVNRAAEKIPGVFPSGQSLQAEDFTLIDGVVDSTLADLAARDVVSVTDDDAIPAELFEWLADCLAQNVSGDFGVTRDASVTLYAEKQLRTITASRPSYERQQAEYF